LQVNEGRRWDTRYSAPGYLFGEHPAPLLVELATVARLLPPAGRALDLAMGEGQNACYLASLGLEVEGVDISALAIRKARALARRRGVRLHARCADLRRIELPAARYDLLTCFHFLRRELFGSMREAVALRGLLVLEIATVRNLERHPNPSRPYVLEEGEAQAIFSDWQVLLSREGWRDDHHVAQMVARRP
jgi:SAM-dependent methyltransferase